MKKGPLLLIIVLAIILIFTLGLQYGRHVEEMDKTISYLLSITPSPTSSKPPIEALAYNTFDKACSVRFIYPSTLTVTKEGSQEAFLNNGTDTQSIGLSCKPTVPNYSPTETKEATTAVHLEGRTLMGYRSEDQDTVTFTQKHPTKSFTVIITVSQDLLPLIERTLEFVR